jgi:cell division protein FtsL
VAAYMHGNLAIEERQSQKPKIKETRRVVTRPRALPMQEKLLYLFTVCICVVVAGVIIWRYAQIYDMNNKIQIIESNIQKLEAENSSLKHQIDKMNKPDQMMSDAKELGLGPSEEGQTVRIGVNSQAAGQKSGGKMALGR